MSDSTPNPAGILCGHGHRHASVALVRECHLGRTNPRPATWGAFPQSTVPSVPVPPAVPVAPRSVTPAPAPEALLEAIRRHGVTVAPGTSAHDARAILARLADGKAAREESIKAEVPSPSDPASGALKASSLGIPAAMIFALHSGYYAVSPTGTKRLEFVRLTVIKSQKGKVNFREGWMKVQTQHGEHLRVQAYVTPEGDIHLASMSMSETRLAAIFMGVIVDQQKAAYLYGREKGCCCCCGKTLTDERSRHYGIGPECEKRWPQIIARVDEVEGEFHYGEALEV